MEYNQDKCQKCQHWNREVCLDENGNPIPRTEKLATEPFWYHQTCKKNWGLPQVAYRDGNRCHLFKEKK